MQYKIIGMLVVLAFVAISLAWSQTYQLSAILGSENFKHDEGVKGVAFSPDGKYLVSSAGKDVIFWERETGKKLKTISKLSYGTSYLEYSPNGQWIGIEDTC